MEIFHKDMLILDTLKAPFCSIFMKQHHFAGTFWNFEIVCSRQYICPVEMEKTPMKFCRSRDRSAARNLRHKKELGPRITPYANRSRNIIWYYTLYHGNQESNIQTRNKSHWLSHRQIVDASLLSVLVYQKINFEKEHADMARRIFVGLGREFPGKQPSFYFRPLLPGDGKILQHTHGAW